MPSRREFCGALVGALVGSVAAGCRKKGLPVEPRPAEPVAAEPKAEAPAAGRGIARPAHPEETIPPAEAPRQDALSGIRRVKSSGIELVVVAGHRPAAMARLGVEAIGGIRRFVDRGSRVVISPNFAWARPPGTGITTDPSVVREVILMCQEAGARQIVCIDNATDPTPRAHRINGALRAMEGTRAALISPWSAEQYVRVGDFERGVLHARLGWQAVPQALLACDVLISVPVFKHHREAGVTGSIKKQMGCVWRRSAYHKLDLDGCLAELGAILRPTLVVTDATRILCSNGPEGPGKRCEPNRVLVATDPVLADAYACRFVGAEPEKVRHLVQAARLGAGDLELGKGRIEHAGVKG